MRPAGENGDPWNTSLGLLPQKCLDRNAWIVQEVTRRLPARIDPRDSDFCINKRSGKRDAAGGSPAHGEQEERNGQHDGNWRDWCAAYIAGEQAGTELPK